MNLLYCEKLSWEGLSFPVIVRGVRLLQQSGVPLFYFTRLSKNSPTACRTSEATDLNSLLAIFCSSFNCLSSSLIASVFGCVFGIATRYYSPLHSSTTKNNACASVAGPRGVFPTVWHSAPNWAIVFACCSPPCFPLSTDIR